MRLWSLLSNCQLFVAHFVFSSVSHSLRVYVIVKLSTFRAISLYSSPKAGKDYIRSRTSKSIGMKILNEFFIATHLTSLRSMVNWSVWTQPIGVHRASSSRLWLETTTNRRIRHSHFNKFTPTEPLYSKWKWKMKAVMCVIKCQTWKLNKILLAILCCLFIQDNSCTSILFSRWCFGFTSIANITHKRAVDRVMFTHTNYTTTQ